MAPKEQKNVDVSKVGVYLRGAAKYLVGTLFGPEGLPWQTPMSRLEDVVFSVQQALAAEMFANALGNQSRDHAQIPNSLLLCPGCRTALCCTDAQLRSVQTPVGLACWTEPAAYCSGCRRSYFPQSRSLGIDQTGASPSVVRKIIHAASRCRSFAEASDLLHDLAGLDIDPKQVERLLHRVGQERVDDRQQRTAAFLALPLVKRFAAPEGITAPDLAVVMVDGGRLQIRKVTGTESNQPETSTQEEDGSKATVEEEAADAGDSKKKGHWREDKVALLMSMASISAPSDPCPTIPTGFLVRGRISKLVRELGKKVPAGEDAVGDAVDADEEDRVLQECSRYIPPRPVLRKVLASRWVWREFGDIVAAEAWALGFQEAKRKAFVADGSDNNWDIKRRYFGAFTAVLDFIHALTYVYAGAQAGRSLVNGFKVYQRWIAWVWSGQVDKVIAEMEATQKEIGTPEPSDGETHPRKVLATALRYLSNHQDKMKYDEYRKAGLPITSSLMESTVKQINHRVKGTEKFWTEEGAEAILQMRADQLSEDKAMDQFWHLREQQASGLRRYRSKPTKQLPRQSANSRKNESTSTSPST